MKMTHGDEHPFSVLHTIMPAELIFPAATPETAETAGRGPAASAYTEIISGGVRLSVRAGVRGGDAVVERIISTDPADYLNPAFSPGTVVKI